jgi:hypothetical protein
MTVVINEVVDRGDPDDWIELLNTTAAASTSAATGTCTDSDPTHTYTFPTDRSCVGAFIALEGEMMRFDFGLTAATRYVLHNASGHRHATRTPGRRSHRWAAQTLPNGTGAFTNRPPHTNPTPT